MSLDFRDPPVGGELTAFSTIEKQSTQPVDSDSSGLWWIPVDAVSSFDRRLFLRR